MSTSLWSVLEYWYSRARARWVLHEEGFYTFEAAVVRAADIQATHSGDFSVTVVEVTA